MQFRCPNCQQPIRVGEETVLTSEDVADQIECPSCHSRFSLSTDTETAASQVLETKIGHFEVVDVLGEGSFGTVYKAWDPELRRHVAIKLPREGRISRDTARLFLREAQAAAGISHPNVVGVYEVGLHNGKHYIATQFIDGISLSEYLRSHSLRFDDAARLVIKLLRAVQVFHDQSIVHRDLKPGNILLGPDNEPHIADFGLARHENPTELTVTQSGRIVGTLLYMPPEQARGDQHQLTTRSDIYAMGVILYELLTGQRPFQASSSRTLLYHILNAEAKPPHKIRSDVPRDLETICLKAMEKEPQRRYESAAAMADDLQRYLDGKPILARPVSAATRCAKWVRRHRALSAAIFVAVISSAAAVVAMLGPAIPDGSQQVVIETTPPADQLSFELYDEARRTPHPSGFQAEGTSGDPVWLLPGFYKVSGTTPDGALHEVWRTVPEVGTTHPLESRYPHYYFVREDVGRDAGSGLVRLPRFRLFHDDELNDRLVPLNGGTWQMGYEAEGTGKSAARHEHTVDRFSIGVNEVSYGQFRRVMNVPTHLGGDRTWLEWFTETWGDRAEFSDEMPVTGYPVDVAILYCELAGGRLPTAAEYEWAATLGGTSDFPTGTAPAVAPDAEWTIIATDEPTPDTTPEGIRNLYNSAAEYTDSSALPYAMLYPKGFTPLTSAALTSTVQWPEPMRAGIIAAREARGAPAEWVTAGTQSGQRNVRARVFVPIGAPTESEIRAKLARIGWRICRDRR